MAYHTSENNIEDVDEFEDESLENLASLPEIESRYRGTYFSFICRRILSWIQLSMDKY